MDAHRAVILVVEDDVSQQELTVTALRHIGVTQPVHCVSGANDGIVYVDAGGQYIDRVAFPCPRLIITGIQMDGGDGFALLRHLKNQPSKYSCPVLVFTSMDNEPHIIQARALGASAYIIKPMTFDKTCEVLRGHCRPFLNLPEISPSVTSRS